MESPYEFYNNKLGVKINYLICDFSSNSKSLKLIAYRTLKKRMDSNNAPETQLRRASLNCDALIEYNSLCREWKDSLVIAFGKPQEEIKKSWFAQHYEADRKAFDFYNAYRYGEDNRKLDTKLIETYTYNASVLNAVIALKTNRKNYARARGVNNVNIWESLSNDVNAFREVEHNLPTTSRGLRIAVNKYQEHGYAGIISGKLQNQNATKLKQDKQLAIIDELLAKHTNLDNTLIASIYNSIAEHNDWPTITPQTVGNRKEENKLVIYAGRNGVNNLKNKVLMQVRREAPSAAMLYWSMDGWDAELLYQKTTTDKRGYSVTTYHNRLNIVVVLDPFNKYPVGYAIGTHETPELIKQALKNAFYHVNELFGGFFRPYQLQTDNYAISKLKPLYEAVSQHFTPARVKNAKAKVIEPYFKEINTKYCKLFDNWSGHGVASGSKNQPNSEYLNKIHNQFPDEQGCINQLVSIMEGERAKKQELFKASFNALEIDFKSQLTLETYLKVLGETTSFTNRLDPDGLNVTIQGQKLCFDNFDINFRKQAHQDWAVFYDSQNLEKVLVTNAKSSNGKLQEIIGTHEFILEQKYIQPMALADRTEGDAAELHKIGNFNKGVIDYIIDQRDENAKLIEQVFENPALKNTLAKMLLVDSKGQHKMPKAIEQKQIEPVLVQQSTELTQEDIDYYNQSKVNFNDYLNGTDY